MLTLEINAGPRSFGLAETNSSVIIPLPSMDFSGRSSGLFSYDRSCKDKIVAKLYHIQITMSYLVQIVMVSHLQSITVILAYKMALSPNYKKKPTLENFAWFVFLGLVELKSMVILLSDISRKLSASIPLVESY